VTELTYLTEMWAEPDTELPMTQPMMAESSTQQRVELIYELKLELLIAETTDLVELVELQRQR